MFLKDDLDYPSSPIFLSRPPNRSWKVTTRTQSKNGQISEGGGEERKQKRLETPKSIPLRAKPQRPAARGPLHLLREPFQRNLTRSESARRSAATFILKERYKLLPTSLLPALTGAARASRNPAPRSPGGQRTSAGRGPLRRRPPAASSPVPSRTGPPRPRASTVSIPRAAAKADHRLAVTRGHFGSRSLARKHPTGPPLALQNPAEWPRPGEGLRAPRAPLAGRLPSQRAVAAPGRTPRPWRSRS